ncbi:DUF309 domain-containing protein [Chengkuizengella axinellae]|uniref:DUF309 domain-containing protein n=1 Tax=Chengkuizengella axinellae TaxID=3064388 RepID=A0ABT9IYW4_9BACL|nr:DUF309 domain-containing protein [Chengkuizengella sp. 2205SS18-9]MDP5274561.1 DUF309 domain-containing protein [Chengkuizengella sp. 2205SS18-9]
MSIYDSLYVEYVYYFNIDRDYFECHEVLEELWLNEGRSPIYQGLLQVAVALHHFSNNNITGGVKLFTLALEKLEANRNLADDLGIDLDKLIYDSTVYLNKLKRYKDHPFPFYDLDIRIIDAVLAEEVNDLIQNPPSKHDEEDMD